MKVYSRKAARVMDPRTMMPIDPKGTNINPKGFETYWHRQKLAGDVFDSAEARDEAEKPAQAVESKSSKDKKGSK